MRQRRLVISINFRQKQNATSCNSFIRMSLAGMKNPEITGALHGIRIRVGIGRCINDFVLCGTGGFGINSESLLRQITEFIKILTATGEYVYRRPEDGIYVVQIGCLKH